MSKHRTTFLRISDLLTQNSLSAQNSLPTYTVCTKSLILMSLRRQLSVIGNFLWSWIRGWDGEGSSPGNRILLAFCFWWRSSVLLGQWSWSRIATTEDSNFSPKGSTWDFSQLIFTKITSSPFTSSAVITLPISCSVFVPLGSI